MVRIQKLRSGCINYYFEKGESIKDLEDRYFLVSGFPVGICPKCGEKLVIKNGKYGKFIACSGFKDGCKNTYNLKNFKTAFAFEVSRIPSKIRALEIHWSLYKRD